MPAGRMDHGHSFFWVESRQPEAVAANEKAPHSAELRF